MRFHLESHQWGNGGADIWGPVHLLVVIFAGYNGLSGVIVNRKYEAPKVKGGCDIKTPFLYGKMGFLAKNSPFGGTNFFGGGEISLNHTVHT